MIALAELRHNPRRIIAVVLAIMISVGYLAASVTVVASESATMERGVIARVANTDVVVTVAGQHAAEQNSGLLQQIRQVEGVESADLSYLSHGRVSGSSEWVQQQSVPDNPALRWTGLAAGEWPQGPDEIALGTVTAEQLNLAVGDQITISDTGSSATLKVTGLTHEGNSLLSGLAQSSFVAPAFYTGASTIRTSLQTEILVIGVAPERLAEKIRAVAGVSGVETSAEFVQRKMSDQAGGVFVFQLLLLVFGAIALLVGGIMIVNTFLVLVAQRRRQIGLLRAIGASAAQVRRNLLVEALVIGAVGSIAGALLGVGVAALVALGIGEHLTVPIGQIALVAATGVVITVLAVLGPARRATRIPPLDALRPVADRSTERRSSRVRTAVAAVLVVGGLALNTVEGPYALLFAVGGQFVCAIGLLLATGAYLPLVLRALGSVVRGPVARLAVSNTLRNPGRAAATGAALVLAVGLVVTLQVGAASMKATANDNLDVRFPVDVTVSVFDGALPAHTEAAIAKVVGIAEAEPLKATRAALGAAHLRVLAHESVPDDRILADPYLATSSTTLTGTTGAVTLPIVQDFLAPADTLLVSPAVMERIDANAVVGTVWAKASPDADITELRAQLRAVVAPIPGVEVGGGLSAKASYHEFLDRILLVTTMLLAVAVLIALIGVGNTLSLSVLERTRESALLRALGLQGHDLRRMLAIEAVLLSLSGTVAGIGAGVLFGWAGTRAISAELNFRDTAFAMSVPQTATVAAVAIVAGVVASIMPGRRAARASPVAALAEE
ncbi:FtsX-like permease family protein [Lentzea tibetensis]|uniref:FtsX-like permease family protein n=1 Tax=Lentzea tibetensis TaxID=2591470 RepID=A0A563EHT1_9PSEU|nr:FtsX-like permease family protein [Lentzea tibetensis]TWP46114.1 FtsX-like permease family protein [Lentzea tibetensis]